MTMKHLSKMGAALVVLLFAFAVPAQANLMFTLGSDGNFSGGGNPTGPFGTVTTTDGTGANGIAVGTVQVSLSLAPNVFANTGSADTLEFSLFGHPTITTSNITNLMFTGPGAPPIATFTLDINPNVPNGANVTGFGIGLNCVGCGNGTSPPVYDSLVFDITALGGLTSNSFVAGDAAGYYFLADIGIAGANGQIVATGYTGSFGGDCTNCGGGNQNEVPEPGSLTMIGTMLIGLGGMVGIRRRRRN